MLGRFAGMTSPLLGTACVARTHHSTKLSNDGGELSKIKPWRKLSLRQKWRFVIFFYLLYISYLCAFSQSGSHIYILWHKRCTKR